MKTRLMLGTVATLFVAGLAVAPVAYATPQQDKMKACNADAKDKAGDERKAFMKQCLSAKKPEEASTMTPQQQKMKSCNAEAKAKAIKGDERKKFMSTCLKG
jgi:uncharacterized protein HemX